MPPAPSVYRIQTRHVNGGDMLASAASLVARHVLFTSAAAVPSIFCVVLFAMALHSVRLRAVVPCALTRVPDASSSIHAAVMEDTHDGEGPTSGTVVVVTVPPGTRAAPGPHPAAVGPQPDREGCAAALAARRRSASPALGPRARIED